MKVAQVAPLYESVPPKLYGGTERVVSYLTEELVKMGHEVTLFASGDSETAARLIPSCASSLRLSKGCIDQLAHHFVMLEDVMEHAEEFDIVHFHVDYLHFPLSRISRLPHITTLHGRLDIPDQIERFAPQLGLQPLGDLEALGGGYIDILQHVAAEIAESARKIADVAHQLFI